MITAIIDLLVQLVVNVISATSYVGIFLLMALESCGIPIPSEVIMPFSGFLVSRGDLLLSFVVLAGTFGNLAGSLIAYWIGRVGGRPLLEKYGKYFLISKHDLDVADRWFSKRGDFTVFIGRLLPVIRTYISFPAGIAKMDLKRFSFYTFAGALPLCALFAWLGVKMGDNWELIRQKIHEFDVTIIVIVAVVVAWYIWRHVKNNR